MAAPSAAPSGRCLIYVDMTASVDPEFRRQTVLRITDTIPHFIAAFRCATLSVGTFADEGPFAPMTEIQVDQPAPPDDCTRRHTRWKGCKNYRQSERIQRLLPAARGHGPAVSGRKPSLSRCARNPKTSWRKSAPSLTLICQPAASAPPCIAFFPARSRSERR